MQLRGLLSKNGGGGGIRTLEAGSAHQHAFQACALNRSATPPRLTLYGGEGGIRTHETGLYRLPDFESGSFDQLRHLSVLLFNFLSPLAKKTGQQLLTLLLHNVLDDIKLMIQTRIAPYLIQAY